MKKVIDYKNLPSKSPLGITLIYILFNKTYDIPGIAQGVFITLLFLFHIVWIVSLFNEEKIDIFKEDK